jgi:hypothetical protein
MLADRMLWEGPRRRAHYLAVLPDPEFAMV